MLKRSLSVLLTVLMTLSLVMVPAMGVSANVEKVDITDYVPNLDDDLITTGPNGSENKAGITSQNLSGTVYTIKAVDDTAATTGNNDILQPMKGIQYTESVYKNMQSNVPFVLKFVAKKDATSTSDVNLAYGIFDGGKGGKDYGWSWTNQWIYTEKITSTEGQEVSQIFTITYPITTNTQLKIGMTCGNSNAAYAGKEEYAYIPGSVLKLDYSTIYFAPERAYDVENEISMTKVMPGATVMGSASVINQIGTKGNIDQTITYYVTDTEGNVKDGVRIDATSNGQYKAIVDANAEDGDYVITARSAAYSTEDELMQASVVLTVKDIDYSDASVAPVGATLGSELLLTKVTGAAYDYGIDVEKNGKIYTITARDSQPNKPTGVARPAGGVQWKFTDGVKGDKYIFTFRVKKNETSAVTPNLIFGFGDAAMGGSAANSNWTTQTFYVMDIESTEWQTIVQEITLPYSTTAANSVAALGLGAGSQQSWTNRTDDDFRPGASIIVDMDSFGIYKDGVCVVDNKALTSTNVFAGQTIEAKAEVLNAAGTKGSLDQTIDYIVLDSETRKTMSNDITITTGADGNYTINVSEDAAAGNYVAVASNETNGTIVRSGLEFSVETIDKYIENYTPETAQSITFGNTGSIAKYGISVLSDATTNWKYRITAAASRADSDIPTAFNYPAAGYKFVIPNGNITAGNTYVISFKARNLSPEGVVPNLVYALIDDGQGGKGQGYGWVGQFSWAEELTTYGEWVTITKTVTIPFNDSTSTSLTVGLGTGNQHTDYKNKENFDFRPNAVIEIDPTTKFLALETPHNVMAEASAEVVRAGSTVELDATAVNQVGEAGTLSQNFTWAPLNASKTGVAEGITITPSETDSSKVNVSFDRSVEEGEYIIAAHSEDYEMTRHVKITVSNKTAVENVVVDTENKTVTFDAVNVAPGGMNGAVYVAEYVPGFDTFVKAEKVPFTLTAGNTKAKEVEYTLEIAEGNELRVYIWDNNLKPYIQPVSKKNN